MLKRLTALSASFLFFSAAYAQNPSPEVQASSITVIGTPADYKRLAGSGTYLSPAALAVFQDTDINAILEIVPGVNIVEEDGYGLRPNIGIRAAQSDRSSKVTYMEDGILMNPAPYAQPSAYYFPRAGRMHSVEIVKGPASTRFGPYTIGGAINLNTAPIPTASFNKATVELGDDKAHLLHIQHGQAIGRVSYVLDGYQEKADGFKQLDTGGDTGFDIGALTGKLRYTLDNQSFELKLGYVDEVSDETYWGLTAADFAATPYRRYAGTQIDQMDSEHKQAVFTHIYDFNNSAKLTTQIYKTWFDRNWYKLDKVGGGSFDTVTTSASKLAVLRGGNSSLACIAAPNEVNCANTALDVKANNRMYKASGIQVKLNFSSGRHGVEIGIRDHVDEMKRVQWEDKYYMEDGIMHLFDEGIAGEAGGSNNRFEEAKAHSIYISDEIEFEHLTVTPGVRMEDIDGARYEGIAGATIQPRSLLKEQNSYDEIMASLGATYQLNDETLLVGGIYEGFSPTGVANDEAETAVIYEAGVRWNRGVHNFELIYHKTNFDNLVATCTQATGGTCDIGSTFNGDGAEVSGIELSASAQYLIEGLVFPVALIYTYTDTAFSSSFDASTYAQWGEVTAGDAFPYVSENQLALSLAIMGARWQADMRVKYKSEMRTVAGQGDIIDSEKIGSHTVIDLAMTYDMQDDMTLKLGVRNLLDKVYAVSRHPDGLRPGLPRTASLSLSQSF